MLQHRIAWPRPAGGQFRKGELEDLAGAAEGIELAAEAGQRIRSGKIVRRRHSVQACGEPAELAREQAPGLRVLAGDRAGLVGQQDAAGRRGA